MRLSPVELPRPAANLFDYLAFCRSGRSNSVSLSRGRSSMMKLRPNRWIPVAVLACWAPVVSLHAAGAPSIAIAAMNRDTAAVRALIARKVDVNAVGSDGTSALHWTVRAGDLETARLLIQAGANAKLANRLGVTPLSMATANGDADMIRLLVDAGAEVNAPDIAGET